MKKMVKSLLATSMAAAMALTMAPMAAAADPTNTANASVYAPKDIIDVVVPTKIALGINPLQLQLQNTINHYDGKTQIVSGTYFIQNRSTLPVSVEVGIAITPATGVVYLTDEGVDAVNDGTDKTNKDKACFSLDMVTTAAGSTQTATVSDDHPVQTEANEANTASWLIQDDGITDAKGNSTVKISKASTQSIYVDKTGFKRTFWLNKGPYTPEFKVVDDNGTPKEVVNYVAKKGAAFDTVAFTFTGKVSSAATPWANLAANAANKVVLTYKLTKSTDLDYNANGYSPIWKGIALADTDVAGKTTHTQVNYDNKISSSNPVITFDKELKFTEYKEKAENDPHPSNNGKANVENSKLDIQSLQTDNKKISVSLQQLGIDWGEQDSKLVVTPAEYLSDGKTVDSTKPGITKITIDITKFKDLELVKGTKIPSGFYLVSLGKDSTIIKYTAPTA